MNKFEQVSSLGHQMSLPRGARTWKSKLNKVEHVGSNGGGFLLSEVPYLRCLGPRLECSCAVKCPGGEGAGPEGSMYSEVLCLGGGEAQCTMGNGNMGPLPPCEQTHTHD